MQTRLEISLGGTLILLSIYFGVVASEIIAYANTTTTSLLGIPYIIAFFLGIALLCGFIGFYMLSALVPSNSN
jgi:flagellar biosynthesis protein FliQ